MGYSLQVCYNAVRELGNRSKVIKFVPRRTESVYISVIPGSGCWSFVGRIGGRQELSLTSCGCFSKGTIQHEFMHAIGMSHEQTCPDRDRYIRINWGNIQGGRASSNLKKKQTSTKNGVSIGQSNGASNQDIIDMHLMYQCVSGARTLSQYNANRCTYDCKCW